MTPTLVQGYHEEARSAGVPAITTAGIYPGISNLMAAHMISIARREYNADWSFVGSSTSRCAAATDITRELVTAGSASSELAEV